MLQKVAEFLSPEELFQAAAQRWETGDLAGCLESLDQLDKKAGATPPSCYLYSLVHFKSGNANLVLQKTAQGIGLANDQTPPGLLADLHKLKAAALEKSGDIEKARDAYNSAARIAEKEPDRWLDLFQCELKLDDFGAAETSLDNVRSLSNEPSARLKAGEAEWHWRLGEVSSAMGHLETALSIGPPTSDLISQYLFCQNYLQGEHPHAASIKHGALINAAFPNSEQSSPQHEHIHPSGDAIRIAFISPDLKEHSVAYFLLPLLENLKEHPEAEAHCISLSNDRDAVTDHLEAASESFSQINVDEVLETLQKIGPDLVIDLAGHSSHQTLLWLESIKNSGFRVATWLGYPNTVGHTAAAFRFVDQNTDPTESSLEPITEGRVYIDDSFLCYSPPQDVPGLVPPPSSSSDFVTFGCMNNLNKLSDEMISLWAKLLTQDIRFQLLIKSPVFNSAFGKERFLNRCSKLSIASEQLILLPRSNSTFAHLETYHKIDICLDTFPYNGTTTTCESLLMGCPVVTLSGSNHRSRVSHSILKNVGRPEWTVSSKSQFIEIASALASDLENLKKIRFTLRDELFKSKLCDGKLFSENFLHACQGVINR